MPRPETAALETIGILKATGMWPKGQQLWKAPLQLRHQNHSQVFKSVQHQMTLLELNSSEYLKQFVSGIALKKLDSFEILAQSVISQVFKVCS